MPQRAGWMVRRSEKRNRILSRNQSPSQAPFLSRSRRLTPTNYRRQIHPLRWTGYPHPSKGYRRRKRGFPLQRQAQAVDREWNLAH
ncbi:hypothetical protein C6A88_09360 [Mycolicibacterium austroafricanum]|nr:hypothetical protein C6A88_09360 [Mycolicibacterium austroafricanum]